MTFKIAVMNEVLNRKITGRNDNRLKIIRKKLV